MPENQGEKKRVEERDLAKATKAKKALADSVRLAAELRVLNQTSLTKLSREWAEKLFDTSRMSGPEFEGWKAAGLDLFGDSGGEAADIAREVGTKPRDGYVTVRGDGKIIARHRGDEFTFTSELTRPWVNTAREVEFADLPDAIEADAGDTGFGGGDDPEPFDDDPSGFLEGMSRTAQNGGAIDPSKFPTEAEAKDKILKGADGAKLSVGTRGQVGSVAENIAGIMDTTRRLIQRGAEIKVGTIARPDLIVNPDLDLPPPNPATFGDDLSAPPPSAPSTPPTTAPVPSDPTLSGPELDPAKDLATPRPWFAPGPVHDRKKKERGIEYLAAAFSAGVKRSVGNGWRGLAQFTTSDKNTVLKLVFMMRDDVAGNYEKLQQWKQVYGVPPNTPDDLIQTLYAERKENEGRGRGVVRGELLTKYRDQLSAFDHGFESTKSYRTGTTLRAEALSEYHDAVKKFQEMGGDEASMEFAHTLGQNAITVTAAAVGAASGVGLAAGAGAGVLDALADMGETGDATDGQISLLVNAATLGWGARTLPALDGVKKRLGDRFAEAVGRATKDPKGLAEDAAALWRSKHGLAAESVLQSYGSEVVQAFARRIREDREDSDSN